MENLEAEVVDRDHKFARSSENQPSKKIRLSKIGNLVKNFYLLKGKIGRSEKREEKVLDKIDSLAKTKEDFETENISRQELDIIDSKIDKLNIKLKHFAKRTEVLKSKQAKRIKIKDKALGRLKRICRSLGNKLTKLGSNGLENQINQANIPSSINNEPSSTVPNTGVDLGNDVNQENISNFVNGAFNDTTNAENSNETITEDSTEENKKEEEIPNSNVELPLEENSENNVVLTSEDESNKTIEEDGELSDNFNGYSLEIPTPETIDADSFIGNIIEDKEEKNQENMENEETNPLENDVNSTRENVIVTPTMQNPVNMLNDNFAYNAGVADMIGYNAMQKTMEENTYKNSLDFKLSKSDLRKEAKLASKRDTDRRTEELDAEANALMGKLGMDLNILTEDEKNELFEVCKKRIITKRYKDQIKAQEAQEAENLRIAKEQSLNSIYNTINNIIDHDNDEAKLAQERAESTREQAEKIAEVAKLDLAIMLGDEDNTYSNNESKGSK